MGKVLQRKTLRKRIDAAKRLEEIKRYTAKPVMKNIDVQAIKQEFRDRKAASGK